jgi:hypothetical protein
MLMENSSSIRERMERFLKERGLQKYIPGRVG